MGPMSEDSILDLLRAVREGHVELDTAAARLERVLAPGGEPLAAGDEAPFARIDHQRPLRTGVPEVVLGSAKTPADLVAIAHSILAQGDRLLVTRVDESRVAALTDAFSDAVHHERARAVTVSRGAEAARRTGVLICAAGTGDVPVAEEARITAEWMGEAPEVLYDVGVAGLGRLLSQQDRLDAARVIIVAAGMEGALPSVVGGLVGVPVIAVPTSVGYGAHLEGLAPLLAMMNACAPGVSVVNIDNGFGAGYLAALINKRGS